MIKLAKKNLIFIFFLLACEQQNTIHYPDWLNEEAIKSKNTITKGPYKDSRGGYNQTVNASKKYRYLTYSYPKNEYYPFWLYNLSINLDNLNLNSLALKEIEKLISYKDESVFPIDIKRIKSLKTLKEIPFSIQLKLLAKEKKIDEFNNLLNNFSPSSNYSMFKTAEAFMLLGKNEKSLEYLKESVKLKSHLRIHKRSSTTAGAVGLAYTMKSLHSIDTLASWLFKINSDVPPKEYCRLNSKGLPDIYSKRQWQSSLAIINKFKELSSHININPKQVSFNDGLYQGSCRGFIDTIKVNVKIRNNKINNIDIIEQKEDRPYTSFVTIPKRIIDSQSLKVDAVTSATITSYAIIGAVAEATLKAY